MISLKPPTSEGLELRISCFHPMRSANLEYMRWRSAANSEAVSPAVAARISTMTFLASSGSRGSRRCLSSAGSLPSFSRSAASWARASSASSASPEAIAASSSATVAWVRRWSASTCSVCSSAARSFDRSRSLRGSLAISGRPSSPVSSAKRSSLFFSASHMLTIPPSLDERDFGRRRGGRALERHHPLVAAHALQRRDRHLAHREIGLARREALELEPGPHQGADQRLAGMARAEPDELEGDPGDERHAGDAQQVIAQAVGPADEREHDDAHDHDQEQERGAAARMEAREGLDALGLERDPRLEGVDRLVLGAVVAEHAAHLLPLADERQVEHERREAEQAVDQPEADAALEAEPDREARREHDEHEDAQGERDRAREQLGAALDRRGLAGRRGLAAGGLVGAEIERADAEREGLEQANRAAHDRQTEQAVAPRDRVERLLHQRGRAPGTAHPDRGPRGRRHHDAFDHRLAADGQEWHGAPLAVRDRGRRRGRKRRSSMLESRRGLQAPGLEVP